MSRHRYSSVPPSLPSTLPFFTIAPAATAPPAALPSAPFPFPPFAVIDQLPPKTPEQSSTPSKRSHSSTQVRVNRTRSHISVLWPETWESSVLPYLTISPRPSSSRPDIGLGILTRLLRIARLIARTDDPNVDPLFLSSEEKTIALEKFVGILRNGHRVSNVNKNVKRSSFRGFGRGRWSLNKLDGLIKDLMGPDDGDDAMNMGQSPLSPLFENAPSSTFIEQDASSSHPAPLLQHSNDTPRASSSSTYLHPSPPLDLQINSNSQPRPQPRAEDEEYKKSRLPILVKTLPAWLLSAHRQSIQSQSNRINTASPEQPTIESNIDSQPPPEPRNTTTTTTKMKKRCPLWVLMPSGFVASIDKNAQDDEPRCMNEKVLQEVSGSSIDPALPGKESQRDLGRARHIWEEGFDLDLWWTVDLSVNDESSNMNKNKDKNMNMDKDSDRARTNNNNVENNHMRTDDDNNTINDGTRTDDDNMNNDQMRIDDDSTNNNRTRTDNEQEDRDHNNSDNDEDDVSEDQVRLTVRIGSLPSLMPHRQRVCNRILNLLDRSDCSTSVFRSISKVLLQKRILSGDLHITPVWILGDEIDPSHFQCSVKDLVTKLLPIGEARAIAFLEYMNTDGLIVRESNIPLATAYKQTFVDLNWLSGRRFGVDLIDFHNLLNQVDGPSQISASHATHLELIEAFGPTLEESFADRFSAVHITAQCSQIGLVDQSIPLHWLEMMKELEQELYMSRGLWTLVISNSGLVEFVPPRERGRIVTVLAGFALLSVENRTNKGSEGFPWEVRLLSPGQSAVIPSNTRYYWYNCTDTMVEQHDWYHESIWMNTETLYDVQTKRTEIETIATSTEDDEFLTWHQAHLIRALSSTCARLLDSDGFVTDAHASRSRIAKQVFNILRYLSTQSDLPHLHLRIVNMLLSVVNALKTHLAAQD